MIKQLPKNLDRCGECKGDQRDQHGRNILGGSESWELITQISDSSYFSKGFVTLQTLLEPPLVTN